MRHYNVTLRHKGDLANEIPLFGVTPAEIIILREVHGDDSVVKIVEADWRERDQAELRAELRAKYEVGEHLQGRVNAILGPAHVALPEALDSAQEAEFRNLAASKEKDEAARKAALDAEVERQVAERMAALKVQSEAAEAEKAINEDAEPVRRENPPPKRPKNMGPAYMDGLKLGEEADRGERVLTPEQEKVVELARARQAEWDAYHEANAKAEQAVA